MRYFISALIFVLSFFEGYGQIDCSEVKDSFRLRIVTLSTPNPWQQLPTAYVVEKEGNYYVFYSKEHWSYCDILEVQSLIESAWKQYKTQVVRVKNKGEKISE